MAETGDSACSGTVYLPAADRHLEVGRGGKLTLSRAPPVLGFRPSANVLFESAARTYGPSTLAVVLTGMGNDGAAGASTVRALGGVVIAQDEASSVIFGMPQATIDNGAANLTLRSEEHTSELPSLMRISYAVFCLKN